jgi:glycosyltransferase involved in cell wall biosynthesis
VAERKLAAKVGAVLVSVPVLPVSVVIPAFDAGRFIAEAVSAALTQTRPPLEVIVVDDGSRDDTAARARAAGAVVFSQANAGPGAARNAGIRAARGEWIALLDADDVWHPRKLELQWEAHERAPQAHLIATDFVLASPHGQIAPSVLRTHQAYRETKRSAAGDGVVFIDRRDAARGLAAGQFLCPSTVMVVKELAERVPFAEPGRLPPDGVWHIAEDLEWYLRVLRFTDVLVLERPLVDYLAHPGSRSWRTGPVRYGDTKLADVVQADPQAYAEGTLDSLRAVRPRKLREASVAFLQEGDYHSARIVLDEAWRFRGRPDDAALLALAIACDRRAGRVVADAARTTWRRALKPSIARFRRFKL